MFTKHLQVRQQRRIVDDIAKHRKAPVQQIRAGRRQL